MYPILVPNVICECLISKRDHWSLGPYQDGRSPIYRPMGIIHKSIDTTKVISRLDHCSSILVGLPLALIARPDRVLRCAARLIGCIPKYICMLLFQHINATPCIGSQLLSTSLIGWLLWFGGAFLVVSLLTSASSE